MSHFFAYMARMKHIRRWSLMRNTLPENDQEHALQVAMIAHALAILRNTLHGGQLDADRVAVMALYHDAGEVITGDLATPIKYYNPDIRTAYQAIEKAVQKKLLSMLPEAMQPAYARLLCPDERGEEWAVVKAADSIAAYVKCVEELKAGNGEFQKAAEAIRKKIDESPYPEVAYFMREFSPSFGLTLDELN